MTDDLTLRLVRPEDAGAIRAIYAPVVEETAISFEFEPPSVEEVARRMANRGFYPWLVAERDGEVAGYAYATSFRGRPAYQWSAETAIYVSASHRRRGVARALCVALFDLLARQGFRSAWAGITLPNDASVTLHESLGFTAVGVLERVGFKFDRWHDVGLWRRDLTDGASDPPTPPVSPGELAATPRWPTGIERPAGS